MSTQNSLPDLCEFFVRLENNPSDLNLVDCIVDLRVHKGEIPLGDEECEVCFSKLTISVDLEGLEQPHERLGDLRRNLSIPLEKTTTAKKFKENDLQKSFKLPNSIDNFKDAVSFQASRQDNASEEE